MPSCSAAEFAPGRAGRPKASKNPAEYAIELDHDRPDHFGTQLAIEQACRSPGNPRSRLERPPRWAPRAACPTRAASVTCSQRRAASSVSPRYPGRLTQGCRASLPRPSTRRQRGKRRASGLAAEPYKGPRRGSARDTDHSPIRLPPRRVRVVRRLAPLYGCPPPGVRALRFCLLPERRALRPSLITPQRFQPEPCLDCRMSLQLLQGRRKQVLRPDSGRQELPASLLRRLPRSRPLPPTRATRRTSKALLPSRGRSKPSLPGRSRVRLAPQRKGH